MNFFKMLHICICSSDRIQKCLLIIIFAASKSAIFQKVGLLYQPQNLSAISADEDKLKVCITTEDKDVQFFTNIRIPPIEVTSRDICIVSLIMSKTYIKDPMMFMGIMIKICQNDSNLIEINNIGMQIIFFSMYFKNVR